MRTEKHTKSTNPKVTKPASKAPVKAKSTYGEGERDTYILVATGEMGVGKSFLSAKLAEEYLRRFPNRKVIVFDVNDEDYYSRANGYIHLGFDIDEIIAAKKHEKKTGQKVMTQSEKMIKSLPAGQKYRISADTKSGIKMSVDQQKITVEAISNNYIGGLVIYEDINKYMTNFASDNIQVMWKTVRHNSQDIIIHMQSLNPVRPNIFEAARVFRLHYDGFDLSKIKPRLAGDYVYFKIAEYIINREYRELNNPRFFVYVHHKIKKLKNITPEQFEYGANKYITHHPAEMQALAREIAILNGRMAPKSSDYVAARKKWVEDMKKICL